MSVAVNQGVRAADEAMEELQRPILRSRDFHDAVVSFKESGPGAIRFQGR